MQCLPDPPISSQRVLPPGAMRIGRRGHQAGDSLKDHNGQLEGKPTARPRVMSTGSSASSGRCMVAPASSCCGCECSVQAEVAQGAHAHHHLMGRRKQQLTTRRPGSRAHGAKRSGLSVWRVTRHRLCSPDHRAETIGNPRHIVCGRPAKSFKVAVISFRKRG